MAAMVAARRALLAYRHSPRGALTGLLAPSPVPAPTLRLPRPMDSPLGLSEVGCAQYLVPPRAFSSFASERIDGDYRHGGEYGEPRSEHPTDNLNRSVRPDRPLAAFFREVDGNQRGVVNVDAKYGYIPEQPYQSGSAHGQLSPKGNASGNHLLYPAARADNAMSGYNVGQPYGSSSAYGQPSTSGNVPNSHQQYSGLRGSNAISGYNTGQTYENPLGYGVYNTGGRIPNNQQSYDGKKATDGHDGYSPRQSYQSSTGYDQQGFYGHRDIHQRPDGVYSEGPASVVSQYPNPTGFHKDNTAGSQQGPNSNYGHNAGQAYQNPHMTNQVSAQSNYRGYPMDVNLDVQQNPHGIHQEKRPDFQSGPHLNSGSYQGWEGNNASVPGNPHDGSPSDRSHEVYKGTIDELDELCQQGKVKEALEVLSLLWEKGTTLGVLQYFKLMQACGDAATVVEARKIHNQISQTVHNVDTDVNNKILEMYAKCGSMEDAKKLFDGMAQRNSTSWDTMIMGFVNNGLAEEAIDLFTEFKQMGHKPDSAMFVHVFLACGVTGSVNEGMLHFESMEKDFGISPCMEHYVSIVSMLGQSGYVDEAREFVERMPVDPSIDVWETLMNMSRLNGFAELGDRCAQIVERLESSRLNEHSKMGLFPVKASDLAKEKERKKARLLEVRSRVHEYRAGDRSHPEHLKIYEQLRYLAAHMKEAGYIADTRFVLHDVDQETKEEALLAHSERLAVGYGLITSAARSPIRVIKNLRSCGDCHTALKIVSKLVGRQIIARDAKRFHHFENGVCSCKDYW